MPLLTGRAARARRRPRSSPRSRTRDGSARPWSVPTVAADDPDFSPERMWRGPVWVNTNALVIEGLRASGHPELARDLAERTVDARHPRRRPARVLQPRTRDEKAETATTAFGWSAALFIDLAVGLSASSVE